MPDDQTTKPAPEQGAPAADPAELADEDVKKVSGGAYEFYQRTGPAGVKQTHGVGAAAPVENEPSPAINISRR